MQTKICCLCDKLATYEHQSKAYCKYHIGTVTLKTEVYSRIVGYLRPIQNWNKGKHQEFKDRKVYSQQKAIETASQQR